jgi:DNA-binding transcriptional regulator YiaG
MENKKTKTGVLGALKLLLESGGEITVAALSTQMAVSHRQADRYAQELSDADFAEREHGKIKAAGWARRMISALGILSPAKLREMRLSLRLPQRRAAVRLNTTRATLANYESCRRSIPADWTIESVWESLMRYEAKDN